MSRTNRIRVEFAEETSKYTLLVQLFHHPCLKSRAFPSPSPLSRSLSDSRCSNHTTNGKPERERRRIRPQSQKFKTSASSLFYNVEKKVIRNKRNKLTAKTNQCTLTIDCPAAVTPLRHLPRRR